jgi:hypothetical protein
MLARHLSIAVLVAAGTLWVPVLSALVMSEPVAGTAAAAALWFITVVVIVACCSGPDRHTP